MLNFDFVNASFLYKKANFIKRGNLKIKFAYKVEIVFYFHYLEYNISGVCVKMVNYLLSFAKLSSNQNSTPFSLFSVPYLLWCWLRIA